MLMGDCCDFINYTDKRFSLAEVAVNLRPELDDLARQAANQFIKFYAPIKDKIIALVPGNHDKTISKHYHFNVVGYIAEQLGVPLLSTVSRLTIYLGSTKGGIHRSFDVSGIVSHAKKGAITLSAKVAAVERMHKFHHDIDFFAQAHMHEYLTYEGVLIGRGGAKGSPRVKERPFMLFLTGGYLKTYDDGPGGYGEDRGYPPTKLGSPRMCMKMKRTSRMVDGKKKAHDVKYFRGF